MVKRQELAKYDLDAIFAEALQTRKDEESRRLEIESAPDFAIYRKFLQSGMSLNAFEKQNGYTMHYLRRRFEKWHLPILEITGEELEQARAEARKRNAELLCMNDDCFVCQVLKMRGIGNKC